MKYDNKQLKQGHFEMGIRYANCMPISNRCARERAALCPLTKCYHRLLYYGVVANESRKKTITVVDLDLPELQFHGVSFAVNIVCFI